MVDLASTAPVAQGDVILDKYVVERVLGAGGMGVVVAARHRELDTLVAIKFMLPAALADKDAVERFLREARAAVRLRSEHVARVHDVGRLPNGAPFMVMEMLTGSDLQVLLLRRGTVPLAEAVGWVAQACEALSEAHELGIVHRDVKPSNLFLTQRKSGSACLKVLDFGLSKSVGPGASMEMTTTATVMGSPLYMSPEQLLSSKRVDLRSDVWSLGAVLFELVVGRPPFGGETITELFANVRDTPCPLPSSLRPDVPKDVDTLILTCLAKRPDDRYQNAGELLLALQAFLEGRPLPGAGSKLGETRQSIELAPAPDLERPARSGIGRTAIGWEAPPARSSLPLALRVGIAAGVLGLGVWFLLRSPPPAPAPPETAWVAPPVSAPVPSVTPAPPPSAEAEPPPAVSSSSPPVASAPRKLRPSAPGGRPPTPAGAPSAAAKPRYEGIF